MPRKFYCAKDDVAQSRIALLGIPFDSTSSFRPGSRFAPDAIRMYSEGIESYSPYQDKDLEDIDFYDAGNIEITISNFAALQAAVASHVDGLLQAGKKLIALGGEHLISLPVVAAYHTHYPDLKVIHFDAHADLRDDYLGEKYSHATVIRRISDLIGGKNVYQFGIRSGMREEFEFGHSATNFYPFALNVQAFKNLIETFQRTPVYVTIDLDVLDPSCFPGTGTPEAGGFSFQELLQALLLLNRLNIVGADLVELCPVYDHSEVSTMTAVKLVREMLLLLAP